MQVGSDDLWGGGSISEGWLEVLVPFVLLIKASVCTPMPLPKKHDQAAFFKSRVALQNSELQPSHVWDAGREGYACIYKKLHRLNRCPRSLCPNQMDPAMLCSDKSCLETLHVK